MTDDQNTNYDDEQTETEDEFSPFRHILFDPDGWAWPAFMIELRRAPGHDGFQEMAWETLDWQVDPSDVIILDGSTLQFEERVALDAASSTCSTRARGRRPVSFHCQVLLPELGFSVDAGLEDLVRACWRRGIATVESCIGWRKPSTGEVLSIIFFCDFVHALRWERLTGLNYADEDDEGDWILSACFPASDIPDIVAALRWLGGKALRLPAPGSGGHSFAVVDGGRSGLLETRSSPRSTCRDRRSSDARGATSSLRSGHWSRASTRGRVARASPRSRSPDTPARP
jgi:hypothetical protein